PELIAEILLLPPEKLAELKEVSARYPILVSPYYLSLIDPEDNDDPIMRQAIPVIDEILDKSGMYDPLEEEKDMPVAGLTHRYPDRVLLVLTNICPTYCRFCTRKRILGKAGKVALHRHFASALEYIREHKEIHDVVLSGGDPLTLPNAILRRVIMEISRLENVDIIRLGTRAPVTLPMRFFDDELLHILE
ncbi:MAG: KamA family radical SAM protein, partial [bacterium]